MIEDIPNRIFEKVRSVVAGKEPVLIPAASKRRGLKLPQDIYGDLLGFVGVSRRDEFGFLRIEEENGCKEGVCVDVVFDARPSIWQAGTYLHGHLLANGKVRSGEWGVTVVDGDDDNIGRFGDAQEFRQILEDIRSRLLKTD
jgi:hypothetical protein